MVGCNDKPIIYLEKTSLTSTQIAWFAGIFFSSIAINSALVKIISSKGINHPNLICVFLNSLTSFVGGYFAFRLINLATGFVFIAFNALSILIIIFIGTRRDIRAIKFSKDIFTSFQKLDLQTIFILTELTTHPNPELLKAVRRTQRWALSELTRILGLEREKPEACILVPKDSRFHVVAYDGIENYKIAAIEEKMKFSPNPEGIAGQAMINRKQIIINDLSDMSDNNATNWIPLVATEEKKGSLFVHPISKGLAGRNEQPLAIVCIATNKIKAFDEKSVKKLMVYFEPKIEILQICWELIVQKIGV